MKKVLIQPGVCGLSTRVEANSEDGMEVQVKIVSACEAVRNIAEVLGDIWDAFEVCLGKPGTGPLYEYAAEHMPGHNLQSNNAAGYVSRTQSAARAVYDNLLFLSMASI